MDQVDSESLGQCHARSPFLIHGKCSRQNALVLIVWLQYKVRAAEHAGKTTGATLHRDQTTTCDLDSSLTGQVKRDFFTAPLTEEQIWTPIKKQSHEGLAMIIARVVPIERQQPSVREVS